MDRRSGEGSRPASRGAEDPAVERGRRAAGTTDGRRTRWRPRLGPRSARVVAGLLGVLAVGQLAVCLLLAVLNRVTLERYLAEYIVFLVAATLSFATVGLPICRRRPGNVVGWLLLAAGTGFGLVGWIQQYARYALVTEPGALPAAEPIAWVNFWSWIPVVALAVVYLPLLFPDGRLPSARWRPLGWLAGLATAALILTLALRPGPVDDTLREVPNPYAPAWAEPVLTVLDPIAFALVLASLAGAVAAPVARYRRARAVERQQLKWFAYAAGLVAVAFVLPPALDPSGFPENTVFTGTIQALAIPLLPAAVGIAILRHRLFDIDLVINRTLVYGLLTAALGLVYAAGVLLLPQVSRPLVGGSDLAVAGSTLAVAALFRPLRARIQGAVDHRFYRRKYDAQRTVDAFRARLRDEVDLDALGQELRQVVQETVQPAHVSLWLRAPSTHPSGETS